MKILKRFRRVRGMTLIEVLVSLAMLSIILTFLGATFMFGINVLSGSATAAQKSDAVAGNVEIADGTGTLTSSVTSQAGTFALTFNDGTSSAVPGNYFNGTDTKNNIAYKSFMPNPPTTP